jgi:hypothetical protein
MLYEIYSIFPTEEHEKLFQLPETIWFFLRGMNLALSPVRRKGLCRRLNMKKVILAVALLLGLTQSGCAFLGGAALGTLATGAGYEINARSQMDKLEADYRNERISRREYEARKAQIEKGSIIY